MLILNEEKYAENLYYGKNNEVKSTVAKIGYITRYLMHSLKFDDGVIYSHTVAWMKDNHANFDESTYVNLISDAIKRAHKTPFYNIEHITITQSELDIISTLEDIKAEKVLFVLLCIAKLQAVSYGFTQGLVKYSLPDLCKMARISVPTEDREYVLYNIIQTGLLGYPKKNNTQCLFVNFMNPEGDVVLQLNEEHCKDLAYEYLTWKNNGDGYARCEFCGRVIKQSKSNPKRYCKECLNMFGDIPNDIKVVKCVDCQKLVYVSVLNTKTCRCDDCQKNANDNQNRERQKRWYDTHMKT